MKVEELMIGDYVQVIESNPLEMAHGCATVVGIDRKTSIEPYTIGFEYTFYDDEGKERIALNSCSIDSLRPIPLTPEILENVGFIKYDTLLDTKGLWVTIYNENYFEGELNYVHELQHAMRLCGIEKEIEL